MHTFNLHITAGVSQIFLRRSSKAALLNHEQVCRLVQMQTLIQEVCCGFEIYISTKLPGAAGTSHVSITWELLKMLHLRPHSTSMETETLATLGSESPSHFFFLLILPGVECINSYSWSGQDLVNLEAGQVGKSLISPRSLRDASGSCSPSELLEAANRTLCNVCGR